MAGIATRLPAGQSGVRFPVQAKYLSLLQNNHTGSGHQNSLLFNRYWGYFPGVKRPGYEAEHSPSIATIKRRATPLRGRHCLEDPLLIYRSVNKKRSRTNVGSQHKLLS